MRRLREVNEITLNIVQTAENNSVTQYIKQQTTTKTNLYSTNNNVTKSGQGHVPLIW
jgi:hypothetical protein